MTIAPPAVATRALPRWDMTSVFPSLTSPEFEDAFRRFVAAIGAARALCDTHGVRKHESAAASFAAAPVFEEVTGRLNGLSEDLRLLDAYLSALRRSSSNRRSRGSTPLRCASWPNPHAT